MQFTGTLPLIKLPSRTEIGTSGPGMVYLLSLGKELLVPEWCIVSGITSPRKVYQLCLCKELNMGHQLSIFKQLLIPE